MVKGFKVELQKYVMQPFNLEVTNEYDVMQIYIVTTHLHIKLEQNNSDELLRKDTTIKRILSKVLPKK